MSQYFSKPYEPFGEDINVKVDLSNATGVDTPKFDKKVDLTSPKFNVDKLDIDKMKNAPTNLSNLKIKVDKLDIDN